MSTLQERELIEFTKKFVQDNFDVPVRDEKITPKISAWALDLNEEMLLASTGITFFESIWKATFPGKANFKSFSDVIGLLKDAAKDGVKAYLKGEKKLMVQNTIRLKWRSIVSMYFNYDGVADDSDFKIPYTFSDRVREMF